MSLLSQTISTHPILVLAIFLASFCLQSETTDVNYCGVGEYLDTSIETGERSCRPCPDGMFMDEPKHTNIECAICKRAEELLYEVEKESCTKTKDTVILCTENHFRQLRGGDIQPTCVRCQPCGKFGKTKDLPRVIQPCEDYHDTVCGK